MYKSYSGNLTVTTQAVRLECAIVQGMFECVFSTLINFDSCCRVETLIRYVLLVLSTIFILILIKSGNLTVAIKTVS